MRTPTPLPVAVRAFTVPADGGEGKPAAVERGPEPRWSKLVVLVDCETTTDERQALRFGAYRVCRWQCRAPKNSPHLACLKEGLFYADDLPDTDPEGFKKLERYVRDYAADVANSLDRRLRLLSRSKFVEELLWKLGYRTRAQIVGFNLPFDLSRLAVNWGKTRRGRMTGGFSFTLFERARARDKRTDNGFRPRIRIKHLDSTRAFIEFSGCRGQGRYRGSFLDLRMAAYALTGQKHSLKSACEAFGVKYGKPIAPSFEVLTPDFVTYCRHDVRATQGLLEAVREEYDKHPISLTPDRLYSSASLARGYLKALGLKPPLQCLEEVSRADLGAAMSAYFGGRAECRIRLWPCPVVLTDVTSMYPTVYTLCRLWEVATSARLGRRDVTAEAVATLQAVSVHRALDKSFWPRLRFLARIQPDGDLLPIRARYAPGSEAWTIGLNYVTWDRGLWYSGYDLAASVLLTGRLPRVLEALAIVPEGRAEGLRAVELRGQVLVEQGADFHRQLVEERHRVRRDLTIPKEEKERLERTLKTTANAGSYGLSAQVNQLELPEGVTQSVWVHGLGPPYECLVGKVEQPGGYCFPPLATLVTGAARFMLATIERLVLDRGGAYVVTDTDSMAIVATAAGGPISCPNGPRQTLEGLPAVQALSWREVEEIVTELEVLKPYGAAVTNPLLKVERENFGEHGQQRQLRMVAVSAKRYAVYAKTPAGEIEIVKPSEHGLGHLLDPRGPDDHAGDRDGERGWIREHLRRLVCQLEGIDPGLEPEWFERPAISRLTFSSPALLTPFAEGATGKPYRDRIKPFNFLVTAPVAHLGVPEGLDPQRCRVIAPFSKVPADWTALQWRDTETGKRIRVSTDSTRRPDTVRVKTIAEVLADHARHPESKSEGRIGLLSRRHVTPARIVHVGKESTRFEEAEAGLPPDWQDVQLEYPMSGSDDWVAEVLPALRVWDLQEVSEGTGIGVRQLRRYLAGQRARSKEKRDNLFRYVRGRRAVEEAP